MKVLPCRGMNWFALLALAYQTNFLLVVFPEAIGALKIMNMWLAFHP